MVVDGPENPVAPIERPHSSCIESSHSVRAGSDSGQSQPAAALGMLLLYAGATLVVLVAMDRTNGLPFSMPGFWYGASWLWPALAILLLAGGVALLIRASPQHRSWRPAAGGRRFRRAVVYTRKECPLCDEALAVLLKYAAYLPPIEQVDVNSDPELAARLGECVPVVELDGKVRFRGWVDERLLRRLIEGTPPVAEEETAAISRSSDSRCTGQKAGREGRK